MNDSTPRRYQTYREFWPFYVSQHLNPVCRALHFVGTTLVLIVGCAAIYRHDARWLWAAPIVGYGFAWAGHFFFEKNRPATFTYPLWSLIGDFQMYFLICAGRLGPHLDRARQP